MQPVLRERLTGAVGGAIAVPGGTQDTLYAFGNLGGCTSAPCEAGASPGRRVEVDETYVETGIVGRQTTKSIVALRQEGGALAGSE